jgi:hypothetical protein
MRNKSGASKYNPSYHGDLLRLSQVPSIIHLCTNAVLPLYVHYLFIIILYLTHKARELFVAQPKQG